MTDSDIAQQTDCKANQSFRKTGIEKPCVECKCKKNPPRCPFYPYRPNCCKILNSKTTTPHHIIPARCLMAKGQRRVWPKENRLVSCENYDVDRSPCICVEGQNQTAKGHGKLHDSFDKNEASHKDGYWTYAQARAAAVKSIMDTQGKKKPGCTRACIKAQLDAYYVSTLNANDDTLVRADPYGNRATPDRLVATKSAAKAGIAKSN